MIRLIPNTLASNGCSRVKKPRFSVLSLFEGSIQLVDHNILYRVDGNLNIALLALK